MLRQIGAEFKAPIEAISDAFTRLELHSRLDRGDIDEMEFHRLLETQFGREVDRSRLLAAASDIFEVNIPMVAAVKHLRKAGKRLVLISNTCGPHIDWIRKQFDVLDPFDDLVLSYEVRKSKPEDEIFEIALAKLGVAPDRCLYTDDIADFVRAGRRHGLNGHVYRTAAAWLAEASRMDCSLRDLSIPDTGQRA